VVVIQTTDIQQIFITIRMTGMAYELQKPSTGGPLERIPDVLYEDSNIVTAKSVSREK
jgi:hypothetical protein